jgi:quinoprotein glucose dehydrogenase
VTYPGYLGGMNWGSAAIDGTRSMMVAVTSHVPNYTRLIPRKEAPGAFPMGRGREGMAALVDINAQAGTPYASKTHPFVSPLGIPCNEPPWGRINGVDLASGKLIWSRPLGTGRDTGPWGIATGLPLTIGTPALGGVLLTGSGIAFVGASVDSTFRAFDTTNGKLLWESSLPRSANSMPISYRSGTSGRQFIAVAAAGHGSLGAPLGDEIVAFALPRR